MPKKQNWIFKSFEDLEEKYLDGKFDCDDIAEFSDPMVLDWISRLSDWAPKVALCFNHYTGSVTLDRISQSGMPELRRLVSFHKNCSLETLERMLTDGDRDIRETAADYLTKRGRGRWSNKGSKPIKA